MGEKPSPLELRFGHFRFLLKSAATFGALLALGALLKDFWKPIDLARQFSYDNWWFMPLMFIAFMALHLVYEVLLIAQRHRIDAERRLTKRPDKTRFQRHPKRIR